MSLSYILVGKGITYYKFFNKGRNVTTNYNNTQKQTQFQALGIHSILEGPTLHELRNNKQIQLKIYTDRFKMSNDRSRQEELRKKGRVKGGVRIKARGWGKVKVKVTGQVLIYFGYKFTLQELDLN